jgi:5'-3' exonuclease
MEDYCLPNQDTMPPTESTFIFIDGSYFCFHRYFALQRWWKSAYPDDPLEVPFENEKFVEKFKKTFLDQLRTMPKKLGIDKKINPIMIVGKDCKREDIWRMDYYKEYKGTRTKDDAFMGGPFFKMAYENNMFIEGGAKCILSHPRLEADDCIALSVKHLITLDPCPNIYIITSDHDYLQLNSPKVQLFNLSYKNFSTGTASNDLKLKILMGDKSDNIPPVFPKCGIKTAQKYIEDETILKNKLEQNPEYKERFELNTKLVCFDEIPALYVEEFLLPKIGKKPSV